MLNISLSHLPDRALLDEAQRVVAHERRATADLIALLAEVDARRLYLGEGCSSLFTYCTQVLHLSEHAAYHRIEAARAARQYPMILERVANGDMTLTTVAMLRPHLTPENHETLLEGARHRSKRDILLLVAELHPRPAVEAAIRKLPAPKPVAKSSRSGRRGIIDWRVRRWPDALRIVSGDDGINPAAAASCRDDPARP